MVNVGDQMLEQQSFVLSDFEFATIHSSKNQVNRKRDKPNNKASHIGLNPTWFSGRES